MYLFRKAHVNYYGHRASLWLWQAASTETSPPKSYAPPGNTGSPNWSESTDVSYHMYCKISMGERHCGKCCGEGHAWERERCLEGQALRWEASAAAATSGMLEGVGRRKNKFKSMNWQLTNWHLFSVGWRTDTVDKLTQLTNWRLKNWRLTNWRLTKWRSVVDLNEQISDTFPDNCNFKEICHRDNFHIQFAAIMLTYILCNFLPAECVSAVEIIHEDFLSHLTINISVAIWTCDSTMERIKQYTLRTERILKLTSKRVSQIMTKTTGY